MKPIDAVNTSLQLAIYQVDVLHCEAMGRAWNDVEELSE